jgi:hypothetical protein
MGTRSMEGDFRFRRHVYQQWPFLLTSFVPVSSPMKLKFNHSREVLRRTSALKYFSSDFGDLDLVAQLRFVQVRSVQHLTYDLG